RVWVDGCGVEGVGVLLAWTSFSTSGFSGCAVWAGWSGRCCWWWAGCGVPEPCPVVLPGPGFGQVEIQASCAVSDPAGEVDQFLADRGEPRFGHPGSMRSGAGEVEDHHGDAEPGL